MANHTVPELLEKLRNLRREYSEVFLVLLLDGEPRTVSANEEALARTLENFLSRGGEPIGFIFYGCEGSQAVGACRSLVPDGENFLWGMVQAIAKDNGLQSERVEG